MHRVFLVVVAALVVACQSEEPVRRPVTVPEAEPANNQGQEADSKEAQLVRLRQEKEAEAKAGVGQSCQQDQECASYLRCPEGSCQVPPAVDGEGASAQTPVVVLMTEQGEAQFYMELALDPAVQQRGLMHRPRMSDQWSMLFVYPQDRHLSFWMRNTLIPLDMVFINDAGVVAGVVENAEPLTETSRSVDADSRDVLEINAGLAARYGIKAGTRVRFTELDPEHQPHRSP